MRVAKFSPIFGNNRSKPSFKTVISTFLSLKLPWVFYQIKKVVFHKNKDVQKILTICKDYDGVIFGGGNIVMSKYGSDYAYRVGKFGQALHDKPTAVYAAGAGPFHFEENKSIQKISEYLGKITLRDSRSVEYFSNSENTPAELFIDPAFVISEISPALGKDKSYIGVNLMDGPLNEEALSFLAHDLVEFCQRESLSVKIINSAFPNDSKAGDILARNIKSISSALKVDRTDLTSDIASISQAYSDLKFFLGTRMHSQIFALSYGVPTIGINWDPKVDSMHREFFQTRYSAKMIYQSMSPLDFSFYETIDLEDCVQLAKKRIYDNAEEMADYFRTAVI